MKVTLVPFIFFKEDITMGETNMWFFSTSITSSMEYGVVYGVVYGETREEAEENMKNYILAEFPKFFDVYNPIDRELLELSRIKTLSKENPIGPTEYYAE